MSTEPTTPFEEAAAERPAGNVLAEFWELLCHNKKWWLLPLVLLILLQALVLLLSGSAAAPFIYPLF